MRHRINASEPDFGVTCKHGPEECAGNVHELCAIKYAPTQRWWNFVHCLNFKGRTEIGKPETALQCAKTTELDWENSGVGACAGLDGSGKAEEGVRMLQQSVAVTEEMGIECVHSHPPVSVCFDIKPARPQEELHYSDQREARLHSRRNVEGVRGGNSHVHLCCTVVADGLFISGRPHPEGLHQAD